MECWEPGLRTGVPNSGLRTRKALFYSGAHGKCYVTTTLPKKNWESISETKIKIFTNNSSPYLTGLNSIKIIWVNLSNNKKILI